MIDKLFFIRNFPLRLIITIQSLFQSQHYQSLRCKRRTQAIELVWSVSEGIYGLLQPLLVELFQHELPD